MRNNNENLKVGHDTVEEWADFVYDESNNSELLMM
jgi:hypothetical protein